ncbi:bacteriorhodopsin-like [Deinococcus sp. 23YEL01]|uniref:bacteriorhodopsin-like n=2 Tax=unclassified Deinococcus TaxID=2623546 RepID=UPI001E5C42D5|nr:bacteriorhodopsin-like [Deinococcus sp. 23YEL01]
MMRRSASFTWLVAVMGMLLGTALAQSASVEAPRLTLTYGQYGLVYQMFSITIAAMGAGFLFFVLAQGNLAPKYRPAMVVSALVVAVACYHYFRIFNSWNESYTLSGEVYRATGIPFNDAYRYADWILTVPLLLVEAVAVLALASHIASGMIWRLTLAAFVMIATGYPGEISSDTGTRLLWGTISTIPFIYILYTLFVELGKSLKHQPPRVQILTRNLRLLLFASWGFYPIAYLLPVLLDGGLSANGVVGLQVGYSLADILAKVGFGTLIYFIALEKTAHDRAVGALEDGATATPAKLPT